MSIELFGKLAVFMDPLAKYSPAQLAALAAAGYTLDVVDGSLSNPEIVRVQSGYVQIAIGDTDAVRVLPAFNPSMSVLVNCGHYSTSGVLGSTLATLEIVDNVTVKAKTGIAAAVSVTQVMFFLIEFLRRVKAVYFHEALLAPGASHDNWLPTSASPDKTLLFHAGSRIDDPLAVFSDAMGRVYWGVPKHVYSERDTTVGTVVMSSFVVEME